MFSGGDYVILTDRRILMMDERPFGSLSASYVNIQWDIPLDRILSIETERRLWHRLFYQMTLKIQVDDRVYVVHNVSYREGQKALGFIEQAQEMCHV